MAEIPEKVLIEQRSKLRSALKRAFQKQLTNPFLHQSGDGGTIFDPAIQRYMSMRVTQYDHFRVTPKTAGIGFLIAIVPVALFTWIFKTSRDANERRYRSGEVAYVDRTFKFQ